jgi:hypothetical protein
MQATVYRFDDLSWRKRARWSRPADPCNVDQFVCQLEQLLKRLRDLHLRISLARLPLAQDESEEGARAGRAIVENLQDPCAVVGMMPDGSVVAAFLGPRGGVGDDEMSDRIRQRFGRALRLADAESAASSLGGLTVAHCWSDEVFDVPSLVLEHAGAGHDIIELGNADRSARREPA